MIAITEPNTAIFTEEQKAIMILWQRVNTSLSAFYTLIKRFKSAILTLKHTPSEWAESKVHAKHIERHRQAEEQEDKDFLIELEKCIAADEFQVVFHEDMRYPQQLLTLFYPPPVLFYRGNIERLNQSQIAIVGSRKPTASAQKLTFDMAQYLAKAGYVITSGLAQGVDNQAHMGALSQPAEFTGRTIGVMGTGIDVCYPKQHKALFDRVVAEGGCIISELLPGTPPNKHTFPRRNRLVAGLSLGTIVTEAAIKSGSLITARLTSEQGKQVFAMPSSIDNMNAEGCHHLIREGATLIYHPEHVISDLSSQVVSPIQRQALSQMVNAGSNDILSDNTLRTDLRSASSPDSSSLSDITPNIDFTPLKNSDAVTSNLDNTAASAFIAHKLASTHTTKQLVKPLLERGLEPVLAPKIPPHLQPLWMYIEYEAQDLDALIQKTELDTAALLSQLMELELMGLISELGGRYKRL